MGNTVGALPQIPKEQPRGGDEKPQEQSQRLSNDENQQEFTCEICIEPTSFSDKKFSNSDECSHPFCTECVIKYIRVKLEDGNAGRITCPALNCDRALDPRACASLVGPPLFVRWCDALCEDAIGGLSRCYCPHRDCSELIVNECGGIVRKSKCPKCRRWFCFECRRVWHAGFGCEEENGETRDENDVAFGKLVEAKKWMRCPRCRHFVELVAGCRIVKCRCGMSFCYNCGKRYNQCRCISASYRQCEYYFEIFMLLIFLICVVILLSLAATHKGLLNKWRHDDDSH